MNAKVSSPISFIFLCLASLLIVSCGGAPEDPNSNNASSGGGSDLINVQGVPTLLSGSIELVPGPQDFDNIEVQVTATVGGLIGNPVSGDITVEFASPEFGVFAEDTCNIPVGSVACSVSWFSAGDRPSDGFAAMVIVIRDGAEEFADLNGNELYDDGEPIENNLSEPFADENGDSTHNEGEFFVDLNENGAWDQAEDPAVWDGPSRFRTGESTGRETSALFAIIQFPICPMEEPETLPIIILDPDTNEPIFTIPADCARFY